MSLNFPSGSVGHHLMRMRGAWHDQIEIYDLAGKSLEMDHWAGAPGPAPFDNIVYIDFDGEHYQQTNVTFRGRPLYIRSFNGVMRDGILHFDPLGPNDPGHIGISGGEGMLLYLAAKVTDASFRYSEPDFIQLFGENKRTRTTVLYRDGIAVRTLCAKGYKLTPDTSRRVSFDPRGVDGSVHDTMVPTYVYQKETKLE